MRKQRTADERTLQDDRADLAADPREGSPLTEDEGAPLAEDGVLRPAKAVTTHGLLGGAPVAVTTDAARPASSDPMTTAEDRPIDD